MHSFVQIHFVISVFRELKAPKENAEVVTAISNILIKSSSAKGFDHSMLFEAMDMPVIFK